MVSFTGLTLAWRVVFAALVVFLALDALDVGLYIAHSLALRDHLDGWARSPFLNMNREFGFGEDLEYLKSSISAAALAVCARRSGEMIFSVLSGLHVWMVLDNALKLHENLGVTIAHYLLGGGSLGLARPTDAGELIFFGLLGLSLLALFTVALRRTQPAFQPTGLLLAAAALSPGATGVFVDGFHALPIARDLSISMLVIIEDGGETAMISVACALALGCLAHSRTWPAAARVQAGPARGASRI
jgi:hypothetical protein